MRTKGIASLLLISLLCLPSLAGAMALAGNAIVHRPIGEWNLPSSLSVAVAAFFGTPLIIAAAAICALVLFRFQVSPRIKLADVMIVGLGMIATLLVSFRPILL